MLRISRSASFVLPQSCTTISASLIATARAVSTVERIVAALFLVGIRMESTGISIILKLPKANRFVPHGLTAPAVIEGAVVRVDVQRCAAVARLPVVGAGSAKKCHSRRLCRNSLVPIVRATVQLIRYPAETPDA